MIHNLSITKNSQRLNNWLKSIFFLALAHRLVYPLAYNPTRNISNDWARHWHNGIELFGSRFWAAIDPKLYQYWIYSINEISSHPTSIGYFTGLLCATMPLTWYMCCKEIMQKNLALLCGIIIAILPSMLLTYGLFMNETITLNMLGLSLWLTFRAYRKKTKASYIIAVIALTLCLLTRLSVTPIVLASYVWLTLASNQKLLKIGQTAIIASLVLIPTGLLNMKTLNFFSPLQFSGPNKLYVLGGTREFILKTEKKQWRFGSPAFNSNPLDPLGLYTSYRIKGAKKYNIEVSNGLGEWIEEIEKAKASYTKEQRLGDIKDNIVHFCFGQQWPFAMKKSKNIGLRINYHMRWIWFPMILTILLSVALTKMEIKQSLIYLWTVCSILAMFFQSSGVMEGRFRVPFEPLILISFILIVYNLTSKGGDKHGILKTCYLAYITPLINLLPKWVNK